MHSIELDQQHSELGTSPPADSCGGKQRRCLPENCPESGGDEFYPLPATRTTTKICSSQTELCKTKPLVRPTTFNGSTSWEDYQAKFELVANLNSWDHRQKRSTWQSVLVVQRKKFSGTLTRTKDQATRSWLKRLTIDLGHRAERRCTVFP